MSARPSWLISTKRMVPYQASLLPHLPLPSALAKSPTLPVPGGWELLRGARPAVAADGPREGDRLGYSRALSDVAAESAASERRQHSVGSIRRFAGVSAVTQIIAEARQCLH